MLSNVIELPGVYTEYAEKHCNSFMNQKTLAHLLFKTYTVSLIARSSLISNCLSGINMATCPIGD